MSKINWSDPRSVGHGVLTVQLLKDTLAKFDREYPPIDLLAIEMEDGKLISPCECVATIADRDSPIVLEIRVLPLTTAIGWPHKLKLHDTTGGKNYSGIWRPIENYPIGATHIKVELTEEARS